MPYMNSFTFMAFVVRYVCIATLKTDKPLF